MPSEQLRVAINQGGACRLLQLLNVRLYTVSLVFEIAVHHNHQQSVGLLQLSVDDCAIVLLPLPCYGIGVWTSHTALGSEFDARAYSFEGT